MRLLALAAAAVAAAWVAPAAQSAVEPVRWCGTDRSQADRSRDRMGGPQIHVVYAIPADGEDRFDALSSGLATDVAAIDAWWRREDPTRAPRFDLFDFPNCESRFGLLDLSFVRLPQPTAALSPVRSRFETIAGTLASSFQFANESKKYLVFYDGTVSGNVCGTASGSPTRGGPFSYAVIYLRASCGTAVGGGQGNALVAAHELIHMLGALPDGARNTCDGDDGHPCDSPLDILWPFLELDLLDQVTLDVNRDDYYGHAGTWFDLQDSFWLLDTAAQFPLSLRVVGSGEIGSAPDGQSCAAACSAEWDGATVVDLRAFAASGFKFTGWSGACRGTNPSCRVETTGPLEAVATFRRIRLLTLAIGGRGAVTATGVRCTRTCRLQRADGETLSLRARPTRGWKFVRWTGACRGTKPTCRVRLNAAKRVGIVFARR